MSARIWPALVLGRPGPRRAILSRSISGMKARETWRCPALVTRASGGTRRPRGGGPWCSARRGTGPAPPAPSACPASSRRPADPCHPAQPPVRAGALSTATARRPGGMSFGGSCRAPAACWCARTTVASAATVHALPSAASHPARKASRTSPTSRPRTSGDAGCTRSSSSRIAPAGPATGSRPGSGGRSRRSPAGDHSAGAPAADERAAAVPAAP